jgi:hypothetical protein
LSGSGGDIIFASWKEGEEVISSEESPTKNPKPGELSLLSFGRALIPRSLVNTT